MCHEEQQHSSSLTSGVGRGCGRLTERASPLRHEPQVSPRSTWRVALNGSFTKWKRLNKQTQNSEPAIVNANDDAVMTSTDTGMFLVFIPDSCQVAVVLQQYSGRTLTVWPVLFRGRSTGREQRIESTFSYLRQAPITMPRSQLTLMSISPDDYHSNHIAPPAHFISSFSFNIGSKYVKAPRIVMLYRAAKCHDGYLSSPRGVSPSLSVYFSPYWRCSSSTMCCASIETAARQCILSNAFSLLGLQC